MRENISNKVVVTEITIQKIYYDPQVEKIIKSSNPHAILKNKSASLSHDVLNDLFITFPIIGYLKNDDFFLCSGMYTFNAAVQILRDNSAVIPVFILKTKPKPKKIRSMFQLYLSNSLVNQLLINDSKYIGQLLDSWFEKEEDKKSIQNSKEWLNLYPDLNTKDKLAKHLSISKRHL